MATQNADLKEAKKDAIMTPDMYRSMFLRQFTSQCSQSYDKMMAMGFMYTIQKPLRKIYPNDDDYYAALDRHTEFFNITPHVLPFVAGLTVSMEEQAAADKNFDTSSINAMKVGLMGPLSGIGDSFYWGTFRVVAAGIGIGIASTGNPLGPIVYALIYSVINFATRIVAAHLGYDLGTKFLQQSEENNLMSRMTHAAGVLGMTVIGAMIAAQVSLSTALTFDVWFGDCPAGSVRFDLPRSAALAGNLCLRRPVQEGRQDHLDHLGYLCDLHHRNGLGSVRGGVMLTAMLARWITN